MDPFLVLHTPQQLVDLLVLGGGHAGALPHLRQVGHQSFNLLLLVPSSGDGHLGPMISWDPILANEPLLIKTGGWKSHCGGWLRGTGWDGSARSLGLSQRHVSWVLGLSTAVVWLVSMATHLLTAGSFTIHILHHEVISMGFLLNEHVSLNITVPHCAKIHHHIVELNKSAAESCCWLET